MSYPNYVASFLRKLQSPAAAGCYNGWCDFVGATSLDSWRTTTRQKAREGHEDLCIEEYLAQTAAPEWYREYSRERMLYVSRGRSRQVS
jgi:hypothetical protein